MGIIFCWEWLGRFMNGCKYAEGGLKPPWLAWIGQWAREGEGVRQGGKGHHNHRPPSLSPSTIATRGSTYSTLRCKGLTLRNHRGGRLDAGDQAQRPRMQEVKSIQSLPPYWCLIDKVYLCGAIRALDALSCAIKLQCQFFPLSSAKWRNRRQIYFSEGKGTVVYNIHCVICTVIGTV